ncbi:MAG: hypothetical protein Q8L14_16960 [Myxococcales bacterium]|nr:hypothetical protein [Myxococcales bacterium]
MKRRLTWAVVVALVVLPLLVLWARRWAAGEQLVAEANALALESFVRPSHRPGSIDGGVAECLERVVPRDGGASPPLDRIDPNELIIALAAQRPLSAGHQTWAEAQRDIANGFRECLKADFVAQTSRFGPLASIDDSMSARSLNMAMNSLRLEALGVIDGGSPLTACLDLAAIERDAPRLDGLIAAMFASQSALATFKPCAAALVHASADDRSRARDTLTVIQAGVPPFADVLRIERVVLSTMHFADVLSASQRSRLPSSAAPSLLEAGEWLKRWASWRPYWDTMKALEAVERSGGDSVVFSSVEARGDAILALFADEEPRAMTRYKRRYESVARKHEAVLLLLRAIDGERVALPPWMTLEVTPQRVLMTVVLERDPVTVDITRE